MNRKELPIFDVLPEIIRATDESKLVIVCTPTGSGKTTVLPIHLLDTLQSPKPKILVVEPRRIAARSAAYRVAEHYGEAPGGKVGFITRTDSRVSSSSRIIFVTSGIFLRMLQDDSGLDGVGLVIFDEVHERGLECDLGISLCLDLSENLRDDLKIILMSATLDRSRFRDFLPGARIVEGEGRSYSVETGYLSGKDKFLDLRMADAIGLALADGASGILCFFPGAPEIRRAEKLLREKYSGNSAVLICPLYGDLGKEAHDRAIKPVPAGFKKIVLASSIAESSITIDGVDAVIDSGLSRKSVFEPSTGLSGLETVRESKASAEQRKGRAGRTRPGRCIRLWQESDSKLMPDFDPPEIFDADLAPLALALAHWGVENPSYLRWIDPPDSAKFAEARNLLLQIGALEKNGRISGDGKKMAGLGVHPRLAAMLLRSAESGSADLACDIAAIVEEKDIIRGGTGQSKNADIRLRTALLDGSMSHDGADRGTASELRRISSLLKKKVALSQDSPKTRNSGDMHGVILSFAYPDRIARRRQGTEGIYLLASGRSAKFANPEALCKSEFIVVAKLDNRSSDAKIHLAVPISREDISLWHAERIEVSEHIVWNEKKRMVESRLKRRLGEIVLEESPLEIPDPEKVAAVLIEGARKICGGALPFCPACKELFARISFLRKLGISEDWTAYDEKHISEQACDLISSNLGGVKTYEEFARPGFLLDKVRRLLGVRALSMLDKLAPLKIRLSNGKTVRVAYEESGVPVVSAKLQELLGTLEHPRIGGMPLVVKILSPAMRPVQTCSDLPGFWRSSYHLVRKDMRGRYPKHAWPEDPLAWKSTSESSASRR